MRIFTRRPRRPEDVIAEEAADLLIDDGDPDPILFSDRLDSLEMVPLTPVESPRRGSWHAPCPICREAFKPDAKVRRVRYADGSRPYVHAEHLDQRDERDGECRHGIAEENCSWCNGSDPYVSFPRSRAFPARRPGRCVVCEEPFGAGEVIFKASSHKGVGWAHGWHRA